MARGAPPRCQSCGQGTTLQGPFRTTPAVRYEACAKQTTSFDVQRMRWTVRNFASAQWQKRDLCGAKWGTKSELGRGETGRRQSEVPTRGNGDVPAGTTSVYLYGKVHPE